MTGVEAHLRECSRCSAELEALRRAVALVESLDEMNPASDFTVRVLAGVRTQSRQSASPGIEQSPARLWPLGVALGAAGFAATVAMVWLVLSISLSDAAHWPVIAMPLVHVTAEVGRQVADALATVLGALARALPGRVAIAFLAANLTLALALSAVAWHRLRHPGRVTANGVMLAL
jgi:hypothetical protein